MGAAWKTVRVFISSTFRDMHAERDHLVRFRVPRLREQDTSAVCREIINECRPCFLCMLGGPYGWVPRHQEAPFAEQVGKPLKSV